MIFKDAKIGIKFLFFYKKTIDFVAKVWYDIYINREGVDENEKSKWSFN